MRTMANVNKAIVRGRGLAAVPLARAAHDIFTILTTTAVTTTTTTTTTATATAMRMARPARMRAITATPPLCRRRHGLGAERASGTFGTFGTFGTDRPAGAGIGHTGVIAPETAARMQRWTFKQGKE